MFDIILAIAFLIVAIPLTARQISYYLNYNPIKQWDTVWKDGSSHISFFVNFIFSCVVFCIGTLIDLFFLILPALLWYFSIKILIDNGIIPI